MNISWQLVRNSTNEPTTKKENSNKNIAHQFTQSSIELSFDLLRVLGLLVGGLLAEHVQVVLLEEAQVLAGLSELALLHALADVPVHKGALRVHQVVLLADALAEHARHRRVVADHHHVAVEERTLVLVAHARRRHLVETDLETGGHPLHEGHLLVGLEPLHSRVRLRWP